MYNNPNLLAMIAQVMQARRAGLPQPGHATWQQGMPTAQPMQPMQQNHLAMRDQLVAGQKGPTMIARKRLGEII